MNKLILALATLAGISVKGDATEDELEAAIKAHKPAPQKFEMNLEDPETKKHFDAAVTAGITAALPAAVTAATKPLEDQVTKLTALVTNGQAGSAQGGKAVEGAGNTGGKTDPAEALRDQLDSTSNPAERGRIAAQLRALRTPAA